MPLQYAVSTAPSTGQTLLSASMFSVIYATNKCQKQPTCRRLLYFCCPRSNKKRRRLHARRLWWKQKRFTVSPCEWIYNQSPTSWILASHIKHSFDLKQVRFRCYLQISFPSKKTILEEWLEGPVPRACMNIHLGPLNKKAKIGLWIKRRRKFCHHFVFSLQSIPSEN